MNDQGSSRRRARGLIAVVGVAAGLALFASLGAPNGCAGSEEEDNGVSASLALSGDGGGDSADSSDSSDACTPGSCSAGGCDPNTEVEVTGCSAPGGVAPKAISADCAKAAARDAFNWVCNQCKKISTKYCAPKPPPKMPCDGKPPKTYTCKCADPTNPPDCTVTISGCEGVTPTTCGCGVASAPGTKGEAYGCN